MKRILSFAAVTILSCATLTQSALASVGTVYLKNNGQYAANVWIDGKYQGRVPAGDTRYAVRDGFVTGDGGSVGGWQTEADAQVVIASTDGKGNNWYSEINLPADSKDDGRVWFGGPLTLNDSDKENANKIIIAGGGNGPTGMLQDAKKAAEDKRDDTANPPAATTDDATTTNETKIVWAPMPIQIAASSFNFKDYIGTWTGGGYKTEYKNYKPATLTISEDRQFELKYEVDYKTTDDEFGQYSGVAMNSYSGKVEDFSGGMVKLTGTGIDNTYQDATAEPFAYLAKLNHGKICYQVYREGSSGSTLSGDDTDGCLEKQ